MTPFSFVNNDVKVFVVESRKLPEECGSCCLIERDCIQKPLTHRETATICLHFNNIYMVLE